MWPRHITTQYPAVLFGFATLCATVGEFGLHSAMEQLTHKILVTSCCDDPGVHVVILSVSKSLTVALCLALN